MAGAFITFEGGEGSGKSTQIALLKDAFAKANLPCVITREPGGVPGAERIRELLVADHGEDWNPMAELLLFQAARLQHVHSLIAPALAKGEMVLCDRFHDSTRVYQGEGKGLSEALIDMLHQLTLGNLAPDLTLILDIDPAIGLKRALERRGKETRFEAMDLDFHRRVRGGYLTIAQREPQRCVVLDADRPIQVLRDDILSAIRTHLAIPV